MSSRRTPKGTWTDRLASVLTLLTLAATGTLALVYLAIALDPAIAFNPYPPPTPTPPPRPSARPTPERDTPTAVPTLSPFISPTPLRPATPTSAPPPTMPFSFTVEQGPIPPLLDCVQSLVAGTVAGPEGEALTEYPVHVWGPGLDTIVLSGSAPSYGPSGWELAAPDGEEGERVWYVQLHRYDVYQVHPPLSGIARVELPDSCPQAMVLFREGP